MRIEQDLFMRANQISCSLFANNFGFFTHNLYHKYCFLYLVHIYLQITNLIIVKKYIRKIFTKKEGIKMNKLKKISAIIGASVLTFTGTCFGSAIAPNISLLSQNSITAEAANVYCEYSDSYGTWKFELGEYATNGTSIHNAKLSIYSFTPKSTSVLNYVAIPQTINNCKVTIDRKTYTINNAKVTDIYPSAFMKSNIKSIFIPSTVKNIQSSAFKECKNLTTVTFGNDSNLEHICNSAFDSCISLKSIVIPNRVKWIDAHAFDNCTNLTNITLPSSLSSIEEAVFRNCSALSNITIPSNVRYLKSNAFTNCTSLRNINCNPNYLEAYGWNSTKSDSTFINCRSLATINNKNIIRNGEVDKEFCNIFNNLNYGDVQIIDNAMKTYIRTIAQNEIINNNCKNDYDKVKALSDYICKRVEYDYESENNIRNHSDYSIFMNDKTVCEGYAQGFALLAQSIGIETYIVHSNSHAWNIVKINNKYYHIDVTWIDGDSSTDNDYKWFLADDEFVKKETKDHSKWDMISNCTMYTKDYKDISKPKCTIKHGDGNCDGYVNKTDYYLLRDYISKRNPKIENIYMFDMNGDGKVDSTDLSYLALSV